MKLTPEAQKNLDMLKEFFRVPDTHSDPQAFLKKRRALAERLYEGTTHDGVVIIPGDAFPVNYDPVTHLRTSPDVERFRTPDGVWYHANGIRDEKRSPKQDLTKIYRF